jgi:hypothetical protein
LKADQPINQSINHLMKSGWKADGVVGRQEALFPEGVEVEGAAVVAGLEAKRLTSHKITTRNFSHLLGWFLTKYQYVHTHLFVYLHTTKVH